MADFIEYPKALYKGLETLVVETIADEKDAAKAGWKTADKRGPAELPGEAFDKSGKLVVPDLFAEPTPETPDEEA